MKKFCLTILAVLFLTGVGFAQTHYALIEVVVKSEKGPVFIMNTATKVPDEESCKKVLSPIDQLKEEYVVRTDCVSGPEWDALLKDTFENKPTGGIYISYKDACGFETRINSKVLLGADFSSKCQLVDPTPQTAIAWADAMIETLEKGGIRGARIIYPRKSK